MARGDTRHVEHEVSVQGCNEVPSESQDVGFFLWTEEGRLTECEAKVNLDTFDDRVGFPREEAEDEQHTEEGQHNELLLTEKEKLMEQALAYMA